MTNKRDRRRTDVAYRYSCTSTTTTQQMQRKLFNYVFWFFYNAYIKFSRQLTCKIWVKSQVSWSRLLWMGIWAYFIMWPTNPTHDTLRKRNVIKGLLPGKLTSCGDDFASLVSQSTGQFFLWRSFAETVLFASKKPVAFLLKMWMKSLLSNNIIGIFNILFEGDKNGSWV